MSGEFLINRLLKILNIFRIFRLSWGIKYLTYSNDRLTCSDTSGKSHSSILLDTYLLPGWYMLEIKINLPSSRVLSNIKIHPHQSLIEICNYALPLDRERDCKRLIHLEKPGKLRVSLPLERGKFELQNFRLQRVTQLFSRSRMITKLQALHPRYKVNCTKHRHNGTVDLLQLTSLTVLWADYCAIFDETREVTPYPDWVKEFDTLTATACASAITHLELFKTWPLISVVMPVYNPNIVWLEKAISSVQTQIYPNWELCIADDASTDAGIRILLEHYAREDKRIKVVFRGQNGHISAASNSALNLARGELIALLDQDDMLAEHALLWVVHAINTHPTSRMFYSDEDKIDEDGVRSNPYFKCDWNLDLFYSQNMFSHLGVFQTSLVREVGGFRTGLEGSQDYDLALRCIERLATDQIHHIARVLYHWRVHADSTAHSSHAKPYAMLAGERAINEHLVRRGVNAKAESVGYGYRVRYILPIRPALVSLIIPTRNGLKLLRRCLDSILSKTSYRPFEVIVIDNGSDDLASLQYLEKLASNPLIRVLRDNGPFNYSALNNAAVKLARGEIIGLINDDIEVINADWLSEMVSHALRPGVAAVGARLWYSDDTLQHAGIVLGIHGIAGHGHRFLPRLDVGYCGRASLIQSLSAVTAACLVVRKSIYQELGGLNETELQVACNDVDFCLRAREAGYKNIWTPYAELYHHESASRGFDDTPEKQARSSKEVAYMKQRWGDVLLNDPAYSPNLTLDSEDFGLAWPPRVPSLDKVLNDMAQAKQTPAVASTITPTLH